MSRHGTSIRRATGSHVLAVAAPPAGPTSAPACRKRKDREEYYHTELDAPRTFKSTHSAPTSSSSLFGLPRPPHVRQPQQWQQPHPLLAHPTQTVAKQSASAPSAPTPFPAKPGGNRLLMAGYLANEFLSHGTLFGRPYNTSAIQADAPSTEELRQKQKRQYEGVASIMWGNGVHVPGVVNPTQLGTWLQKQQQ